MSGHEGGEEGGGEVGGEAVEVGEAGGLEVTEIVDIVEVGEGVHFTPLEEGAGGEGGLEKGRGRKEDNNNNSTFVPSFPRSQHSTSLYLHWRGISVRTG